MVPRRLIGRIFDHLFENPDLFIIKMDFSNAFNSFARSAALQTLFDHIPNLAAIVYKVYGIKNYLLYENMNPIEVSMGSQRGCP